MKSEFTTRNSTLATHSDNEVLVRVEGVSKKFCRSLKRSLWYGVCDIAGELSPFRRRPRAAGDGLPVTGNRVDTDLSGLATRHQTLVTSEARLRPGEFLAVNDVSFELRRGECLGLIGHNGAGKTTLLKMLNGLIKPDAGRIEMNGRVGALIALGAGFNPILTGRENIYINGAVLGLSKSEIDSKIDDIIDFAEIRDFIDMPVQSYSSGMAVRLGFSVASSLNPDILILDEVLAVGDMNFVVKCLNRLRDMASEAAVVLVSHNMQTVSSFCTRVLMMGGGKLLHDATEPTRAIDLYYDLVDRKITVAGSGEVAVKDCVVRAEGVATARECSEFPWGVQACVALTFEVGRDTGGATLQLNITDQSGMPVVAVPVVDTRGSLRVFPAGEHRISVPLGKLDLNAGLFDCTTIFRSAVVSRVFNRSEGLARFRVVSQRSFGSARLLRPALIDQDGGSP